MDSSHDNQSLHFLDYWRVIRSRKEIILAVTILVVITGAAYTFTMPKVYMAETRIEVHQDSLDIEVFNRTAMPTYNPFFLRTEFEIIQSKPILYEVIRNLNLREAWGKTMTSDGSPLRMEDTYIVLSRSIRVEQYRDTSLIAIRVFRPDPKEAADIANQIASVYLEHRLAQKHREITRGLEALQNELQKQKIILDQAEERLEVMRKDLGVALIGSRLQGGGMQSDKVRLQQLEADRGQARVDMLVRKARYDQLAELDDEALLFASNYIVNDQALANLRRQLMDVEVNLRHMLETYGKNHPEVLRVVAARDELRKQISDTLAGLKQGLRADYEVALAKVNAIEEELRLVREADIASERERFLPFEKAEREVRLQRDIFQSLQARIAQEGIELQVPRTPVDIVDPAEAPRQDRYVSPKIALNIFLSLIIGLGAGIGLAYFIEYLDTSVKTVDDVEKNLGLSVLGVIPQKVRPLIEEGPDSPHTEAYRVLRTNLQFTNKGMMGGSYTAVSGGVGEGKSTTLFNLAYVCAQLGDKVLIVDSDLRRPVQHTFLGMSNNFGLTNVLLKDVPLEEAIKATSVPNLHFMPSGKLPRSSVGLLETQRMRELVKNLKTRYDFVFFDSPPIVGVSDASILASEVDGVLLVVQYRKYPRAISERARRILDNVGANALGVVLNNINIMRDDYYYYYHSYYSPYEQSEESMEQADQLADAGAAKKKDSF